MDVLLVCNKSPWPPSEGGPIAMNAMVAGLLEAGHNVKVLAINSNKYQVDIDSIPLDYKSKTDIELVYIDLKVRVIPAFLNLFSSKSLHVERFITTNFANALEKILLRQKFDIIQLESLFIAPYIPLIRKLSAAPILLRAHNIEHLIWQRLQTGTKNPFKRWYFKHLTNTLRSFELDTLSKVDGVIAITPKDAQYFKKHLSEKHVISIPFGIQPEVIEKYTRRINTIVEPTAIFHLGSMNWLPNQEGILWFIENVWPEISTKHKGLTLHLAGRNMPDNIRKLSSESIIIDGEVPDAIDYMHRFQIMAVPLLSGSGIRIKIVEGMMAGCAVVTTTIGAEGINYTNGRHLLIADSASDFKSALNKLITDAEYTSNMGKEAAQFVAHNHNNAILINNLLTFYKQYPQ